MRVIAGSARRLLLKTPPGYETRPTSDKVKETLFNILMPYIYTDTCFLDLFSGSGAIGIESLSRGASKAVFVESSREAVSCIKANLETTHFTDRAVVLNTDVMSALKRLEGQGAYDIIFMDPPYGKQYERTVLEYLSSSSLVSCDTLLVIEADRNTDFDYITGLGYEVVKYKEYKNNCHLFIRPGHEETEES
ncbi:MAG: 16S rRNA (guanine(966)-N(2))-methyltransferase RsmD [Lachnospiraceae bacterium]|nr:16S rRNA (guanine(966)-N(2))-methyltransferase RsmD [Lachnospiraceae bacterium]